MVGQFFLPEVSCPSQLWPNQLCLLLSPVLSLIPASPGTGCSASPEPLDPQSSPSPQAWQRHPLDPASFLPADPSPSPITLCQVSLPIPQRPSSASSLLNEPLCLTPEPPTSLPGPPISFTAFGSSIFSPVPAAPPSPPFPWPLPRAPSPSSPSSCCPWAQQAPCLHLFLSFPLLWFGFLLHPALVSPRAT